MAERIRVLLACDPPMVNQAFRELLRDQLNIEMVGEALDPVELLLAVADKRADVVVVNMPAGRKDLGLSSHLLAEYPELLIIALSSDGNSGVIYRQAIQKRRIPKLDRAAILAEIYKAKWNG